MKCCVDFQTAERLAYSNYFYILHRFYPYKKILDWVNDEHPDMYKSISLGVNNQDIKIVTMLDKDKINCITIDVAHGDHVLVKNMIIHIKKHLPNTKIIAGNVGTVDGALRLQEWGVDAVKVGLSMGKSCTTYNTTGVGSPMFSIVRDCFEDPKLDIPIIADGQIREPGDVCKALVGGATMVMIGSEFAKLKDSPARCFKQLEDPTAGIYTHWKEFYGSASEKNKGHGSYVEGKSVNLRMSELTYAAYYDKIEQAIQSCVSYSGYSSMRDLTFMEFAVHLNN
jgi:GMP reductase